MPGRRIGDNQVAGGAVGIGGQAGDDRLDLDRRLGRARSCSAGRPPRVVARSAHRLADGRAFVLRTHAGRVPCSISGDAGLGLVVLDQGLVGRSLVVATALLAEVLDLGGGSPALAFTSSLGVDAAFTSPASWSAVLVSGMGKPSFQRSGVGASLRRRDPRGPRSLFGSRCRTRSGWQRGAAIARDRGRPCSSGTLPRAGQSSIMGSPIAQPAGELVHALVCFTLSTRARGFWER